MGIFGICKCEHDNGSGLHTRCTNDAGNISAYGVCGRVCPECAATCQFDSLYRMGGHSLYLDNYLDENSPVVVAETSSHVAIAEFHGEHKYLNARDFLVHLYRRGQA